MMIPDYRVLFQNVYIVVDWLKLTLPFLGEFRAKTEVAVSLNALKSLGYKYTTFSISCALHFYDSFEITYTLTSQDL